MTSVAQKEGVQDWSAEMAAACCRGPLFSPVTAIHFYSPLKYASLLSRGRFVMGVSLFI